MKILIEKDLEEVFEGGECEYGLDNNLIFALIMQDPDLCKRVLQRILPNREIGEVRYAGESNVRVSFENDNPEVIIEKVLTNGLNSKGVRLDVFMKDENCWYDIEMQCKKYLDLPQ